MFFLGYDLGSSSVKVCLLDGASGRGVSRACYPDREMTIEAPKPGWAEQPPETWWECAKRATGRLLEGTDIAARDIGAVGISYQMHGLVLLDRDGHVVRPSIIWCDSRAVEVGARAFEAIGESRCLEALLNAPGNFTASKLAWVRENEPANFELAHTMMLPGDYLAWRLTDRAATTISDLSEGIIWDFSKHEKAGFLLEHFAIPASLVPDVVPTFGEQGRLTRAAAEELGLKAGTPVTYRSGDQPNNALSLGVLEPGEIAATAGTSGVVYGISDTLRADPRSRVNSFAHVNHSIEDTRLGILLCINGTGSAYRWLRERLETDYEEMNERASAVPIGCEGLCFFPFGNGVERMLENRDVGASLTHLDFNTHGDAHLARGVQEGVAFAFQYGMEVLRELGMSPAVIRAGRRRKQKSTADYFLAGKNVGWFVVGASLFASNIGSEHLVGLAGAGAESGVVFGHLEFQASIILLLLGWVFVPFYARSGVFTMPEFLERPLLAGGPLVSVGHLDHRLPC